jgi:predicted transposase YbfD/YdcC
LKGHLSWPGFSQAVRIERTCIQGDKHTTEVSYAITSVDKSRASAETLLEANRGHWGIENRLHWVRDVTMGEDACRMKTGEGPQNLAAIRNAGLTLLRTSGCNAIASTLRDYATKPWELLKMLRSFKN